MCIYKIYKTRDEIDRDYKNGNLKVDYIFAYDRRLYIVIDSQFTFYQPLEPIVFKNKYEQEHIVKMCNLLWYDNDIVMRMDDNEIMDICRS